MGKVKSSKLNALISRLTVAANRGVKPAPEVGHPRKYHAHAGQQPKLRVNQRKQSLQAAKLAR